VTRHDEHPATTLRRLGFAPYRTGGNCTALRRAYPDGSYHLIVVEGSHYEGLRAPATDTPPDCHVLVGFYAKTDDSEPTADDFTDSLSSVADLFANHKGGGPCHG